MIVTVSLCVRCWCVCVTQSECVCVCVCLAAARRRVGVFAGALGDVQAGELLGHRGVDAHCVHQQLHCYATSGRRDYVYDMV